MRKNKNLAFTLAEVLVTLGIIGVVAALTIPLLINSYQNAQYVTQLKKIYTQFNQVLIQLTEDFGCTGDLKCTGIFDAGSSNDTIGNEFVKYFKVLKNCGTGTSGCMSTQGADHYDGTLSRFNYDNNYRFIITDGASMTIRTVNNKCDSPTWSNNKTNNMMQACALLTIDVNGPTKGPNYLGRDMFHFWITNGNGPLLYPMGGIDDNSDWGSMSWTNPANGNPRNCYSGNTNGNGCAGRVIEEGWKMNY